ncbi:MAG: peptidase domain-containing ABC transporter [Wenzhouxiangella sp.]
MRRGPLSLTFLGRPSVPLVLQAEGAECGLACLAMVASFHGHRTDLSSLRRRWSVSMKGINLAQLMEMGQGLELTPRALRLELEHLPELKRPAILHWDLDHFVVLERVTTRFAYIVDPAVGRRKLPMAEVSKHFTGVALELSPTAEFQKRKEVTPLPLWSFVSGTKGLGSALFNIFLLSVALQVLLLLAPLFGQIVIDEIVISQDRNLLTVLAVAFLLLAAIQICINGIRGWVVVTLGAQLQFGWVTRLFHHLIRLPLSYFEKRHMGDIVSRFGSIRAVEGLVANSVVAALVDGLMAITTLVVMFVYSPRLALVVIAAVALYAVLRLVIFRALWLASQEALVLDAKENSLFMESVRAILPMKNFGRETLREALWQNRKADALNAEIRVSKLQLIQQLGNTGIFAFENIVVLWVGALAVINTELSIGMLVAFLAYKGQFGARAAALIDTALEFRLVRVHLDRLADIALAERDSGVQPASLAAPPISGAITVSDLWFRYADTEPYVVAGLDLKIRAGECVAIAAPSGFGKTTLIKVMMGLLKPEKGSVLVDQVDIHRGALGNYRRQTAAVMQDDELISGSLADNISFFDPGLDVERMEACARKAAIHEDIQRMPMGYHTLVGDMGSSLSGGQKQRIMLARALYAQPRILFLDEATSHLDPVTEQCVHDALKSMEITRVIVAHRQETLAMADRIIDLAPREVDPVLWSVG